MSEFKTKNKSKWKFHTKFWFSYRRDREYPYLEYSINLIPSIKIWYDSVFFILMIIMKVLTLQLDGYFGQFVCGLFGKNARSEIENK